MHIPNRLHAILAVSLALVPLSAISLLGSVDDKYQTQIDLNRALDDAAASYRSGNGLFALQKSSEDRLQNAAVRLVDADMTKMRARRAVVALDRRILEAKNSYGIDATNTGSLLAFVQKEQGSLAAFARYLLARDAAVHAAAGDLGVSVLTRMLRYSLGEMTDIGVHDRVLERAKLRIFSVVLDAKNANDERGRVFAAYGNSLVAYEDAWADYQNANDAVDAAKQRIEDVRRTTEEVHDQVLRLQAELARIDARLKAKIERQLIDKGRMDAQPGERSDGKVRSQQTFRWPAIGAVSAGFLDAAYQRFFGVPHHGMDIKVGQGSPVFAAADGIVFLARDGGRTGFSYILIGHRDGYATLYGHLSQFAVSTGDEVYGGQMIGLSGGAPGTHGAGPMTTGSHLHFEMMRNGQHIDPKLVLP